MVKVLFSHQGVEVKTTEQKNVMSPLLQPFPFVSVICLGLIWIGQDFYVFLIFGGYMASIIISFFFYSFKNPELLQSEKCRIEMQKISIAQEAKNDNEVFTDSRLVAPKETKLVALNNDKEEKL